MEAMWTRFVPSIVKLRELLAEGAIGEGRMMIADFGFRADVNPHSRLFDPAMGGGGLLDVGVYPISLASMIFGTANRVAGLADIGETGVDEQAGVVLGYEGNCMALVATGVRTRTPGEVTIMGAEGQIRLHPSWWQGGAITLTRSGSEPETIDIPTGGNGYNYEADEVVRCLGEGKTESEVMPLDETLSIMRTLDAIRAQWGLKYPME
jgi:predicted dehydrogenase